MLYKVTAYSLEAMSSGIRKVSVSSSGWQELARTAAQNICETPYNSIRSTLQGAYNYILSVKPNDSPLVSHGEQLSAAAQNLSPVRN